MSTSIHPTAIIEPGATLAEGVCIGPYCHVGSHAVLGAGVVLESHVVVAGRTTIGEATHLYPFVSVGHPPQDLKYHGEPSELYIGSHTVLREHVTMNPGTEGGGMVTRVGDHCLFMVGAHVAHDCQVGNHVVMANNATLAGHVEVGDHVIIGGLAAAVQFTRIGAHAIVGGMSAVESDVIPYGSVVGERAKLAGVNIIGLKRRQFSRDDIHTVRTAYRLLFSPEGTLSERMEDVESRFGSNRLVQDILSFIRAGSTRPGGTRALCQPR